MRSEVVRCCYWPLLRLAKEHNLPFGIEASGYTLETAAAIDPAWLDELRSLTTQGPCEFIGSGYAQIIGPLVPAEVNAANLRIGHQVYERLLGFRPQIALVNEQAYSAGLVQHYLDAGYRAIVMEWDNPARYHPEWNPEWRYLPQLTCGQHGEEIPLIWNKSIAFQKFQRYAHGEMELGEYVEYLGGQVFERPRAFPLYGNDVEIFDFRPGRYHTEAVLPDESEWTRLERLFEALLADGRFRFIRPRQVLELMQAAGAGNRLSLESPEQPIPVKKQGKYNITRWAVSGRDDLGINTDCWRFYEALKSDPSFSDGDWRELCYLWSSDFRTHITEKRWDAHRGRVKAFEEKIGAAPRRKNFSTTKCQTHSLPSEARVERDGRYLTVETDVIKVKLNCRRGLAIDALWFKEVSDQPLVCTLHHGYFDDIALGADYYTGHLVLEAPAQAKITDLSPAQVKVGPWEEPNGLLIRGSLDTPLGPINKSILITLDGEVRLDYRLDWVEMPLGSLRLGHVTLNPEAFVHSDLYFETHNGGVRPERFALASRQVEHGRSVSFLASANGALGMTGGYLNVGDRNRVLSVWVDKDVACVVPQITFTPVGQSFFCRASFSAAELDDTMLGLTRRDFRRRYEMSITAHKSVA